MLQTLEGPLPLGLRSRLLSRRQVVASGLLDSAVRLWDAATGAALQTLEGHSQWVTTVASSSVVQDEWILTKGEKLLWLPPEYRSTEVSIHNSLLCLGLQAGRFIVIGFDYDLVSFYSTSLLLCTNHLSYFFFLSNRTSDSRGQAGRVFCIP